MILVGAGQIQYRQHARNSRSFRCHALRQLQTSGKCVYFTFKRVRVVDLNLTVEFKTAVKEESLLWFWGDRL